MPHPFLFIKGNALLETHNNALNTGIDVQYLPKFSPSCIVDDGCVAPRQMAGPGAVLERHGALLGRGSGQCNAGSQSSIQAHVGVVFRPHWGRHMSPIAWNGVLQRLT